MQGLVALRHGGRLRVDSGCCLREGAERILMIAGIVACRLSERGWRRRSGRGSKKNGRNVTSTVPDDGTTREVTTGVNQVQK
jgi:hypothetical protein